MTMKEVMDQLIAERDQLCAKVAALTAEVERLKVPVGLVWTDHGDEKRSQEIDGHWYEVRISLWGGFYPVFCDARSTQTVKGILNAGAESLAIAACEAHHLARFREMQGVV